MRNFYQEDVEIQLIPKTEYVAVDPFWSLNVKGNIKNKQRLCIMCCPCCVGDCCSNQRKVDYKRMAKFFLFWISIVDILYFIFELVYCGFAPVKENYTFGPSGSCLNRIGGNNKQLIIQGQVYRLVLPIIMHSGFLHIFFNLYVQIRAGFGFEIVWRSKKTAIIYFISGIGGNILSALLSTNTIGVGASGAILGLFGARLMEIVCTWSYFDPKVSKMNFWQTFIFIVLVVGLGLIKSVDLGGHLGGAVYGILIGLFIFSNELENKKKTKYLQLFSIIALITLTGILFSILFTMIKN
ncbi:rhomboid-like protein [Anaeramoeba flamelloides]|uniref:rhomboid protease n=1 Tax=Anaeramoeba flamelloides TaxID=1746091 RepID=A0ABQ8Z583_9EUKA|nr:rhomboid-like protein [Anaeramoeba flamelloides]